MARDNDQGRGLALLAGGGVLAWLLLRGTGLGFAARADAATPPVAPLAIRVDTDGIRVDGERTSLEEAAARTRARGAAEVTFTGAARSGTVTDLLAALRATGARLTVTGGADA